MKLPEPEEAARIHAETHSSLYGPGGQKAYTARIHAAGLAREAAPQSALVIDASQISWGDRPDPHTFTCVSEGHYRLDVPECLAVFDLERLHRDRNDTCGELVVSCAMAGARTFNGNIFSGNINLSQPWRRRDIAKHLTDRANTKGG